MYSFVNICCLLKFVYNSIYNGLSIGDYLFVFESKDLKSKLF